MQQTIDVDEGTWISVDVSPEGDEIVFDLLGDIYSMPITGADGSEDRFPRKLTTGMAWDMPPRFSPDGKWIAFTSDRTGKSEKAGDNVGLCAVMAVSLLKSRTRPFNFSMVMSGRPRATISLLANTSRADDHSGPAKCGCITALP